MSRLVMTDTYVTLYDDNGYPITVEDLATGETIDDAPRDPWRRLAGWGSVLAAGLIVWAAVFAAGWALL